MGASRGRRRPLGPGGSGKAARTRQHRSRACRQGVPSHHPLALLPRALLWLLASAWRALTSPPSSLSGKCSSAVRSPRAAARPCGSSQAGPCPRALNQRPGGQTGGYTFLSQGITGIRFAGGAKCYIKAQVKARVPEVGTATKQSISSELVGTSGLRAATRLGDST